MSTSESCTCPFLALIACASAHRDEIKCPAGLYAGPEKLSGMCAGMSPARPTRSSAESRPVEPAMPTPPRPKALAVSIREAAEMLGVSKRTAMREIYRGQLRGLKVGRMWRVRVVELHEYLKRKERERRQ